MIIGYDEFLPENEKTGSHNLVIGPARSYSSYGGIVTGYGNAISKEYAIALGGMDNLAGGTFSTSIGGYRNRNTGLYGITLGGSDNNVSGQSGGIIAAFNKQTATNGGWWFYGDWKCDGGGGC